MDDEQKQLKARDRALKAQTILDDPTVQEAFQYLDAELIERWKASSDPAARDRLWVAIGLAARVQEVLRLYVRNGRVAKRVLDDLEGKVA